MSEIFVSGTTIPNIFISLIVVILILSTTILALVIIFTRALSVMHREYMHEMRMSTSSNQTPLTQGSPAIFTKRRVAGLKEFEALALSNYCRRIFEFTEN